jgi:hypothetical protein
MRRRDRRRMRRRRRRRRRRMGSRIYICNLYFSMK